MNRPDEIAALADRLRDYLLIGDAGPRIVPAKLIRETVDGLDALADGMARFHAGWNEEVKLRQNLQIELNALRLSATAPGDPVREALKAGKIMLLCEECSDNYPEGCGHFSPDTLRVAPNGKWLCDSCYDEARETDDAPWWQDLPRLPFSLATAEKAGNGMLELSASERACYLWPEDAAEHKASRAAYIQGASDYATPTPPSADVALLRHLSGCARAFLQHFNPCDLAEDKAQQWQALEHQCDLADAAIQSATPTPPSADVARGTDCDYGDGEAPWSEDEQFTEQQNACIARRKKYGQRHCDEKDGSCTECEHDTQETLRRKYLKPSIESQMVSAVRVWLECPADKRPSTAALGARIAELAGGRTEGASR